MIGRVLIANRGEIALRIVRACRELGIQTVAAHSRVDQDSLHLRYADDTVCISDISYLDMAALIAAAVSRGCDAIHPGYGLLAENAEFAREVENAGLSFVGPSAQTIALMADKVEALRAAVKFGLPVADGDRTVLPDVQAARAAVAQLGYPVMLKASFGGGGRGMRLVAGAEQLEAAFAEAAAEALTGFGSGDLYAERYLDRARHIEVQVLGDGHGGAVHFGTRDCSIQRRHQKVIEEAPAPGMDPAALAEIAERCQQAAETMAYRGAGTFEFLWQDDQFSFIEMNTRIQVEHPVTEAITGIDLVKAQLEVAMHGELPVRQQDIRFQGHAIECRLNAELMESRTGLVTASPGLVYDLVQPGGPGIRVDSHLFNGYLVPHHYDSLVSKLISWGRSREEAIHRMTRALGEFEVRGIDTNAGLLRDVMGSDTFQRGSVTTGFLSQWKPTQ